MDDLARLGTHLSAALQGGGTEAERLLLLRTATYALDLLATLAIAFGIGYFLARRKDFEFPGLMLLFALALTGAAVGYGFSLWGLLHPNRWLLGSAQMVAAALAFGTALGFWIYMPDIVRLPSPRQLRRANANLTRESWEQQRTLQEAQEEAQLLRDAFVQSDTATALVSSAGRWLHFNDAFARLTGLPRAELMKHEPHQWIDERLLTCDGERVTDEKEYEVKGERGWHRWIASPVLDATGKIRARLVQCHDLGAEKRNESALARLRQELEAQVAQHAREASEASTLLQQALAERQKSEAELAARTERLARDAEQLEKLGARIRELAGTDPVTGLISSHALAERLDLALASAKRYGQLFTVLVIAADPVDEISSSSETLLAALGAVLHAELRDTDAAARCDEERICVLLPQSNALTAARVAERIRKRVANTPIAARDGRTLRLTCSIGSAEWKAGAGLSDLLGEAAEALRNARTSGRERLPRGNARSDQ